MGKMLDDERFKHVDYHKTDVAKTFARIRAQIKAEQEAQKKPEQASTVITLQPRNVGVK